MLNLYWKIFLGFWLTGLLLGGAAVLVNQQLRADSPLEIRGLSPTEILNRSSFIIRRLPEDFTIWQQDLADNDIFIYRKSINNKSLSSPDYPAYIDAIFEKLETQQYFEHNSFTRLIIGKHEFNADGDAVYLVANLPSAALFWLRHLGEQLTVQILLALALSTVACYSLARYLTRNLAAISSASRSLASGKLSARAKIKSGRFKDEIATLAEDFNLMASALETSVENQKRLVRDISHELRSPLARLQIALELARQKQDSKELDRIELEANRLNDLIGQILETPQQREKARNNIELDSLIQQVIKENQIEAANKSIAINYSNQCKHAKVIANTNQLHSAIENILRNAIHYTDEKTIITVSLAQRADENTVYLISIEDCGPGVPAADIPFIFEPFYRVDLARNRKTGGYGIGLAIVNRVISNLDGKVCATNTGNGLKVEIELPAAS